MINATQKFDSLQFKNTLENFIDNPNFELRSRKNSVMFRSNVTGLVLFEVSNRKKVSFNTEVFPIIPEAKIKSIALKLIKEKFPHLGINMKFTFGQKLGNGFSYSLKF